MLQKITAFVKRLHMIEPGDRIVAGVSGGADSVCLFYVLLELQKSIPFTFCTVHVDHGLREDAFRDAAYVKTLCEAHAIPCELVHEDVGAYAAERRMSEEEAGRELRYRAFAAVNARRYGGEGKIAVAHQRDDRAETTLFRLFRGSGLRGLCGVEPIRGNVIRPLLCVTRAEIEEWLRGRGIGFCTDVTNAADDYARNRIRHHILPYAEREICRGSAAHVCQAAEMLSEAADYLELRTREAYGECVYVRADGAELLIREREFGGLHPYLKGSLIHYCFGELTPAAKNITSAHVGSVCGLFEKQTGRRLNLPCGITARREYEGVALSRRKGRAPAGRVGGAGDTAQAAGTDGFRDTAQAESAGGFRDTAQAESADGFRDALQTAGGEAVLDLTKPRGTVCFGGLRFDYRVFAPEHGADFLQEIPKNDCAKWFDYDTIKKSVRFRYRGAGDYFTIGTAGEKKSVRKYMIDEKIPSDERGRVVLLAEGSHVLWAVGGRISEAYKVSAQTKRIVEIHIAGGKCDG